MAAAGTRLRVVVNLELGMSDASLSTPDAGFELVAAAERLVGSSSLKKAHLERLSDLQAAAQTL